MHFNVLFCSWHGLCSLSCFFFCSSVSRDVGCVLVLVRISCHPILHLAPYRRVAADLTMLYPSPSPTDGPGKNWWSRGNRSCTSIPQCKYVMPGMT